MSGADDGDLSHRAALIALSALPLMGPARLGAVLGRFRPAESWRMLQAGETLPIEVSASVQASWRTAARQLDAMALTERHDAAGITVASRQSNHYPPRLVDDPEPPAVLFWKGAMDAVGSEVACVGIVGTRRCTRYGRDVAFELGCVLGAAGVTVVSGLALGIDAAAHAGVLHAGGTPVGVVASGVDTIYPKANAGLWAQVAERGAVVSEHPLGVRGQRWMFPARNRIIAGLCDVLVVVESGPTGGSFYTVDAALERDRPVFAVPGPVRSEASRGTNRLLADGAAPMCAPEDVLEALRLVGHRANGSVNGAGGSDEGASGSVEETSGSVGVNGAPGNDLAAAPADPISEAVLESFGWQTRSVEELVAASGLSTRVVATQLQILVARGRVVQRAGRFDRAVRHQ